MTCRRPAFGLLQHQRGSVHILTRPVGRPFHIYKGLTARSCLRLQDILPYLYAVFQQGNHQSILTCISEQALVDDFYAAFIRQQVKILIIKLDLLHFRRNPAVCKDNAVTAEVIITRPVPKITAVQKCLPATAVTGTDGLVYIIPDEAALIKLLLICQLSILVHAAVGIAHGMSIFAANKRLIPMLLQKCPDIRCLGIHLALHIAGAIITPVMEQPLIMYQPGRICLPEILVHRKNRLAPEGFIAAGPDEDGRMILVPFQHIPRPLQHCLLPSRIAVRQGIFIREITAIAHPGAVGFQVGFVNHIQSINITQLVDTAAVWIMGTAQGINIVLLHGDNILLNQLQVTGPAAIAVKLMAVSSLKDNPSAIELHDIALQPELAEAHILRNHLLHPSLCILCHQQQPVKVRLLGTPQPYPRQLCRKSAFTCTGQLLHLIQKLFSLCIKQLHQQPFSGCAVPPHLKAQAARLIILCRTGMYKNILHMDSRLGI